MDRFKLVAKFKPAGAQPKAIAQMVANIKSKAESQVLLGVTGSGKTFSIANVIEKTQMPTLVISPNKTLAAQLYQEFRDFFPNNAVHYFVSYYDYYQPEAYIPSTNTYIEKDAKINQEIDRMRHSAVQDLMQRKDAIVVASVSCIYGLGSPKEYQKMSLKIKRGQKTTRSFLLQKLIELQYQRNDFEFKPGLFKALGDAVEIFSVGGEKIIKIEFYGNIIKQISVKKTKNENEKFKIINEISLFPARFWLPEDDRIKNALKEIEKDLAVRIKQLTKEKKFLEAQRIEQKTSYDIEMIKETGYCHGIENYSRYFEMRPPGTPPFTLLDYFSQQESLINQKASNNNKNSGQYLTVIDESHICVSQIRAMYNTDKARKKILIDFGFRLPSCLDNRPLKFVEFEKKSSQTIYVSATPGPYEKIRAEVGVPSSINKKSPFIVEQLIRPTGLLEPKIEIRPSVGQVQDLIKEIAILKKKKQRTLATTLTKKMAEELSMFLQKQNISAQYLHSEIKTLERPKILNKLRSGEYDALIGVNLLREGLDLPEVALVAILDADKEGFLRNETTLIQTMGRAARNIEGRVIMYAGKITLSMRLSCQEIERRRKIQQAYNEKNNINPQTILKNIKGWQEDRKEEIQSEFGLINDIKMLEKEMKTSALNLDFERAAEIRDLIKKLQSS